ncbi:hypothetical protein ACLFLC_21910 [Providencia rettgeri]
MQFDASGKSSVWVVDANNTVQQVAVELGIMQGKLAGYARIKRRR